MSETRQVVVVGAGPVGCVLSVLLARRGFQVTTYEKRPDMRRTDIVAGRSINLVLTRRGLRALELIGLREATLNLTVPVLGRMMHAVDGELAYQPYGKDDSECNYSVSRGKLNEYLLDAAERAGCKIHFDHELVDADFQAGRLQFRRHDVDTEIEVQSHTVFGCDGAPSGVRRALVKNHGVQERVDILDYGYKEVLFPAGPDGSFPLAGHALHIWPRGIHMLMGLANKNQSFTGTIYLAREGSDSFAQIDTVPEVTDFFASHYPDAIPLLEGGWAEEFVSNPIGTLGTVHSAPWFHEDRALLLGDAAHGIVPFFGQGLNCGFEDCAVLAELFETHRDDLGAIFEAFFRRRKPNADAIAEMALENFIEMRDKVGDERFLFKKAIEHRVEQAMPELYRSRYATVMYSYNPYKDAFDAGLIQAQILEQLLDETSSPEKLDLEQARKLIERDLTPFYRERSMTLDF